jgi:hypothetical protein
MKRGEDDIFRTNPDKAISKLTINSFMMGSLFLMFTLVWTLSPEKFGLSILSQLVISIPLLFVSSLAYTKIAYHSKVKLWDALGWFTNTIANVFILNVVGLITATAYPSLALLYFGVIIFLMFIYSSINIYYRPQSFKEKIFKFLFFVLILYFGGIRCLT